MMGYTMSWAAFAAVEVMSSPRFALKRVGYLAACQGLDQPDRSPVVLLTTNLLQKELRGANVNANGGENIYHAGLAINCLSNIATEDLGQALLPELLHMLSHPSPYIRKKALLCLYKVFLKYPQGLRLSYDKIKLCLDDPHPSVVSCAVNVITELAEKNPKNYLPLAPSFFKLLTSSANNWMLIKVVKLLGSLVPEEPRLARKLLEPLSGMVKSTHAKSLLYEAVYAITLCLPYVKKADGTQPANIPEVVELCVETLRSFVSDSDQNLKYLGLVGFGSLMSSQPRVLHSHPECRGLILQCLSDEDVTIRTRALGLLKFMATKRNLADLISQLLSHVEAASGEYRCQLVEEIIRMCSSNKYELVMDFSWYVDVLVILASVRGIDNQGDMIAMQWMDVAWRVLPVRCYAVRRSLEILICRGPGADDEGGSSRRGDAIDSDRHFLPEVLPAAAWIVGEYSQLIPDGVDEEGLNTTFDASSKGPFHALIQALTAPTDAAGMNPLPCSTQAVFVQNAMKVFSAACQRNVETQSNHGINLGKLVCSDEELHACAETLLKNLVIYAESTDPEVKERAFTSYQLLLSIGLPSSISFTTVASAASTCRDSAATLTYLLTPEPMKPISSKAQKRLAAEGPPSPVSVRDWEKGVDWDVFWFAKEETPWFDKDGNVRGSVENISFTKQLSNSTSREVREADAVGTEPISAIQQPFGDITSAVAEKVPFGLGNTTAQPPSRNQRVGDPFYLNSRPSPTNALFTSKGNGMGGGTVDATTPTTRFGVLTLDSGGESEEESGRKQKKKKKKAKKTTKQGMGVAIADSDDEDDDRVPQTKRGSVGKGDRAKEFANLALVDLTIPLGENDVMPKNEHYVVPERPPARQDAAHQKQKKKKKDKDKKKSSREEKTPSTAVTGDLLGFHAMGFGAPIVGKPTPLPALAAPNPINSAFDDLLGLEMHPSVEASAVIKSSQLDEDKARKAAKKAAKKAKKKSKV
jgi:AP-3 complex subunit delta-1